MVSLVCVEAHWNCNSLLLEDPQISNATSLQVPCVLEMVAAQVLFTNSTIEPKA